MAKKRKITTQSDRSQKEVNHKQTDNKTAAPIRKILIVAGFGLILIGFLWTIVPHTETEEWYVDEQGIMSYPIDRGEPENKSIIVEYTTEYCLEYLEYSSRDIVISTILRIPNTSTPVPGILILPGATVTKEMEQDLASELVNMGYASMVIDQRNRGGVNLQDDEQLFKAGKEPEGHKMVFDALKAVDVMRKYHEIDPDNIAIIGISNGGRFAIIATAIDPSIKGVVGISTSGYDMESFINNSSYQITTDQARFLRSVDPDSYLNKLPPRKLIMIHMVNDSIISIDLAQGTYEKADNPKVFRRIEGAGHGYNSAMSPILERELALLFG